MLKNSTEGYGKIQIIFHWLSAIIVFGLFGLGLWMMDLNYYSEWYRTAPDLHKSIGLTLLILTICRVIWKLVNPSPKALSTNKIENKIAKVAHLALYLLMFAIMISGYLISTADGRGIDWFWLFEVPSMGEFIPQQEEVAGDIHEILAYSLIGLVVFHAIAALKHHFINKDKTLVRMVSFKTQETFKDDVS